MGIFGRRRIPASLHSPAELSLTKGLNSIEDFTASAVAMRSGESQEFRRSLPAWQRTALEMYELLGEAWFPAQFYARQLSRVRLYPAVRHPNGEIEEIDNAEAQEILNRIETGGRQSQWKSSYGRLQFLIGDGYLTVSLDRDGEEQWEYLSPAELEIQEKDPNGRQRYLRKGATTALDRQYVAAGEDLDELDKNEMRVWRMWRRHPLNSELADSPMKAVLSLYQYLMLLDKAATAQALSRIVGAGLLVVDDEITIPSADADADDANVEDDPFMSLLTKYIVAPIANPGSAASQAPLVARVSVPEGRSVDDLIKLIQIHDPNQTADWQQKIEKTITRIAIGLDMPPEEFLGLAQANHWTGWVITEEKWKAHGEPVTIQLCDDLTSAYFRPACIAASVEDAENLIVWYDAAQVVTHPDQGKSALEVHKQGALSDASLRKANNFSEKDEPSDEEREFYEAMKLKTSERPDDPSEADASDTGADAPGEAPSQNGKRTNQPSPMPGNQEMKILGFAEMTLDRLRERAGSKIRERRMSCDGCFDGTETVPNHLIASAVGQEVVRAVGIDSELALVSGAADVFFDRLMKEGLSEAKSRALTDWLENHAAATLYDESADLPPDFAEAI